MPEVWQSRWCTVTSGRSVAGPALGRQHVDDRGVEGQPPAATRSTTAHGGEHLGHGGDPEPGGGRDRRAARAVGVPDSRPRRRAPPPGSSASRRTGRALAPTSRSTGSTALSGSADTLHTVAPRARRGNGFPRGAAIRGWGRGRRATQGPSGGAAAGRRRRRCRRRRSGGRPVASAARDEDQAGGRSVLPAAPAAGLRQADHGGDTHSPASITDSP